MCEDRITPVLQGILNSVVAKGKECDLPEWCRVGIVGGSAAWDACCECGDGSGQLWVRLIDWSPDPDFDQPGPTGCQQPTLLTVGVGSLRCVPVLDETGDIPSPEEEQSAATLIHKDAQIVFNAVMCGLDERFWQTWTALDWQGGCGGGEHVFQIPAAPCDCS